MVQGRRKGKAAIVAEAGLCYSRRASGLRAANGRVAEWLRSGLQIRIPRFDSGRGLQFHTLGKLALAVYMAGLPRSAVAQW
jgi:hypothetical protein